MPSLICVICMEGLETKAAMSTTCGHIFCSQCAESQFAISQSCPVCRTPQTFRQLIRLFSEFDTPATDPPPSAVPASTFPPNPEGPYLEPEIISFRWHTQQLQSRRLLTGYHPQQPHRQMLQVQIQPSVRPSRRSVAYFGMLQPRPRPSTLDDMYPLLQSLQELRHAQRPPDHASALLTLQHRSVQLRLSQSRR
ncbi:hypothetical protein GSI_04399 [Ganoderma sinense ZZ0214-1]|uniref:RING-type domain-containing protein n=1 Tax=Ganoderma sinense ZZ0214-1 TaxID=1077348 RepID=A0A2G8SJ27_9APHY|nr:hypothetical protein GSI_04399 [Ganoderma sinense ZZ0214-1]